MGCPAQVEIGDNLTFAITTHDPDTGVVTDADAVPDYWIYEDETGVSINANTPDADVMAKLDDAHTTGFYAETIACTAGNGFENGKTYTIYIEATVGGDKGAISYGFKASNLMTTHTNALAAIFGDTQDIQADTHELQTDWADGGRLDLILDAIGTGTGTGARTVAVTVDDGADALENATVRFTEGGNTYLGSTDASGEVSFSLDDATYTLAIAKPGYSFTPTTLVVDGDETETYSMSAISISAPPNASTTTGVMTVYDEEGSVEEGVEVSVQIIEGPGTDGIGYDSTEWTETSSALGVVEFAGIIHGARYKIWRGDAKANAQTFTAPTSGDSFDLAEIIGSG